MSNDVVLVIGGARSTGLHAAHALQREGARVRVLARKPEEARVRLSSDTEIVCGDVTDRDSLVAAFAGVGHVIFTAGVRSGQFARQSVVRAIEYEGILNTMEAARAHNFRGRSHPDASRTTFEVSWDRGPRQRASWAELLSGLRPDSATTSPTAGLNGSETDGRPRSRESLP